MPKALNRNKSTSTPLSNNCSHNFPTRINSNPNSKAISNLKDDAFKENSVLVCTYPEQQLPQNCSNSNLEANSNSKNDAFENNSLLSNNSSTNIKDAIVLKNNSTKQTLSQLSEHEGNDVRNCDHSNDNDISLTENQNNTRKTIVMWL